MIDWIGDHVAFVFGLAILLGYVLLFGLDYRLGLKRYRKQLVEATSRARFTTTCFDCDAVATPVVGSGNGYRCCRCRKVLRGARHAI